MYSRKAFTLVELLVTLSIAALLAAILFPAFVSARESARRTNCQSNLKQIGIASQAYAQDYDGRLAPLGVSDTMLGKNVGWPQLLRGYTRNTDIFRCQSNTSTAVMSWASSPAPPGYVDPFPTSFIRNVYVEQERGKAISDAQIVEPSTVVHIVDGGAVAKAMTPFVDGSSLPKPSAWVLDTPNNPYTKTQTDLTYAAPAPRHSGLSNVLFFDGHVKAIRPEDWYYPDSNALKIDY